MPCSSQLLSATLTVLIGLLLRGGHVAHAYSSGAPESACGSMVPLHGQPPQQTSSPYIVTVSSGQVSPSATVTVTISGDDFKGFMASAYSGQVAVGRMVALTDQARVVCNGESITQTGPTAKSSVTFQWTAPSDLSPGAQVTIVATIVKEQVIFWTEVLPAEPLVYVVTPPDLPPVGGTSTSTTTNDPGGVLPTPGTALPPTSPATTKLTFAPRGRQRKQDVISSMTGKQDVMSPMTGKQDVMIPMTGKQDVMIPMIGKQDVTSPTTGNPGGKNQVTDWLSMTCVSFLIAFLEVF